MSLNRRAFIHGSAVVAGTLAVGSQGKSEAAVGANLTWSDPMFNQPYTDVDEWRDTPVRHRYVDGGFKGSEVKFSFHFPPREQIQRRFIQYLTSVPVSENATQGAKGEFNTIAFAIESVGYFVESNLGGFAATGGPGVDVDPTIAGYRVSAASAQYSRTPAAQMYGAHQTYGYYFGGSGGPYGNIAGVQKYGCLGRIGPFIMPSPMAVPNVYSVRLNAMRLLGDRFRDVVDAIEPGGSGKIYATLDGEQRQALLEATRFGFPPRGWFNWEAMGQSAFAILNMQVVQNDPTYFTDFWKVPGYLGVNPPPSLLCDGIQHRTRVLRAIKSDQSSRRGGRSGACDLTAQPRRCGRGPPTPVANNHVINYQRHLLQALRDLSAWVERGVPPPETTNYRVNDGQITVAERAADRKGIQPAITLTANSGARAEVRVGQPVEFVGKIETPPGTGSVIAAAWDFDGSGAFAENSTFDQARRVRIGKTHVHGAPGTYNVALRGVSQRQGNGETPFARLNNLARVRVVVT
jgi:hypothetical protein